MYFHVLLDSNNRISIPYQIRKQINLKKGDSLVMTIVDNEIHLNSIDKKISEAQKLVKQYCGDSDLLEDLLLIVWLVIDGLVRKPFTLNSILLLLIFS